MIKLRFNMKKVSIEQLKQIIKEEAQKIVGDALDVKMNKQANVKGSDKEGAHVSIKKNGSFETKTSGPEKGKDPIDVKMNQSKDKGSDKEGANVSIKKNGSFETKKSGPAKGKDPIDTKMNDMDGKTGSDDAKAFVTAGSGKAQKAAKFSEEAKNEKEKEKRIASAIQMPESFKSKKDLGNFILSEAKRISSLI